MMEILNDYISFKQHSLLVTPWLPADDRQGPLFFPLGPNTSLSLQLYLEPCDSDEIPHHLLRVKIRCVFLKKDITLEGSQPRQGWGLQHNFSEKKKKEKKVLHEGKYRLMGSLKLTCIRLITNWNIKTLIKVISEHLIDFFFFPLMKNRVLICKINTFQLTLLILLERYFLLENKQAHAELCTKTSLELCR